MYPLSLSLSLSHQGGIHSALPRYMAYQYHPVVSTNNRKIKSRFFISLFFAQSLHGLY